MTATITTQTTTVVDSAEWAWTEIAADVIDATDNEFYAEHRDAIDQAARHALSAALAAVWSARGFADVAEVPASIFGTLLDSTELPGLTVAEEQTYFEVWETAASDLDFAGLLEAAQLHPEYRAAGV